jgi:chromosome segregation protein
MAIFLRRLELQGFKSFASKTVLDFPSRVTAVVGPNGSGKSNVIDALRWVLGEREAKHLRGDTLGNLIFAGTPKRAPMGFARVALCFGNHDKVFPFDSEEVMLVRKIDRSGVSQFFWHEEETRLKDLVPVLARAKLGSRGLTMIGQGQSDIFVKSSPEDRRMMIEEILGLREYRIKKNQAERQLDSSNINMDKIRAMVEELAPHLRFLRRQKNRWDRRSEIEESLKNLENVYFSRRYHELREGFEKLNGPIGELGGEKEKKENEVGVLEAELKKIDERSYGTDETKVLREKIKNLVVKQSGIEKELARTEARLELHAAKGASVSYAEKELLDFIKSLSEGLKEMTNLDDLGKLKELLNSWLHRIGVFLKEDRSSEEEKLVLELRKLEEDLKSVDGEINTLRDQEEKFLLAQQTVNQEFRARLEVLETKKNELRHVEDRLQHNIFEREKIDLKLSELEREWMSFGRVVTDLRAIPKTGEEIDFPEAERKMMRWRGELAAIGEIDQNLVKEAEESETRYEFLSKELEDLEKAATDLKALVRDLDERIHTDFKNYFRSINDEFSNYFRLMFGGGRAHLKLKKYEPVMRRAEGALGAEGGEVPEPAAEPTEEEKANAELRAGIEIELTLPKKKISSLDMLSGGEKTLVSLAALFALISVSPPPFLVLDEVDAALDDENARRFAELIKEFSKKTQFIVVTHNRVTMEVADILYGVTMGDDGVSKVLSLKLDTAEQTV